MEGRLLVTLPTSLTADILNRWLSVQDRVRLDSAHCHTSLRDEFLDLLRSSEVSVKSWVCDRNGAKTTDNIIRWADRRGVVVDRFSIGEESNLDTYHSYLQKFGAHIRIAKAKSVSAADLDESLSHCHKIEALELFNCEVSASFRNFLVNCHQLRELRCNFWDFERVNLAGLATQVTFMEPKRFSIKGSDLQGVVCPNLRYLQIEICRDQALVNGMLKMAVNLEVLCLSSSTEDTPNGAVFSNINAGLTALALAEVPLTLGACKNLVERFSNLVHLCNSFAHWTVPMVRELAHLKHLKSLDIASSSTTRNDVLIPLAEVCGDRLTELLLCQNYNMSLKAVQKVLPRFTQLTSFSMHYGEDDAHLFDLSLLARIPKLTLIYDGDDGADFVFDLAHHCAPNLRNLQIQLFDENFLAEDMDVLVDRCSKLRLLNLAGELVPLHEEEDVVRWQELNPKLEVCSKFVDELSVLREWDKRQS